MKASGKYRGIGFSFLSASPVRTINLKIILFSKHVDTDETWKIPSTHTRLDVRTTLIKLEGEKKIFLCSHSTVCIRWYETFSSFPIRLQPPANNNFQFSGAFMRYDVVLTPLFSISGIRALRCRIIIPHELSLISIYATSTFTYITTKM